MRVDFYLWIGGKASAKKFYSYLNWPETFMQIGCRVTFALRSTDPTETDNKEKLKIGEVKHEESQTDGVCKVWVDMEELTDGLAENRLQVIGWKGVSAPL